MEAYRREVEKMKQLQEGKEKNKKEVEKKKTLDLVASKKKKKPWLSPSLSPVSLSLCVSLFFSSFRCPAQRRGAAEVHPAAARERDGVEGMNE